MSGNKIRNNVKIKIGWKSVELWKRLRTRGTFTYNDSSF